MIGALTIATTIVIVCFETTHGNSLDASTQLHHVEWLAIPKEVALDENEFQFGNALITQAFIKDGQTRFKQAITDYLNDDVTIPEQSDSEHCNYRFSFQPSQHHFTINSLTADLITSTDTDVIGGFQMTMHLSLDLHGHLFMRYYYHAPYTHICLGHSSCNDDIHLLMELTVSATVKLLWKDGVMTLVPIIFANLDNYALQDGCSHMDRMISRLPIIRDVIRDKMQDGVNKWAMGVSQTITAPEDYPILTSYSPRYHTKFTVKCRYRPVSWSSPSQTDYIQAVYAGRVFIEFADPDVASIEYVPDPSRARLAPPGRYNLTDTRQGHKVALRGALQITDLVSQAGLYGADVTGLFDQEKNATVFDASLFGHLYVSVPQMTVVDQGTVLLNMTAGLVNVTCMDTQTGRNESVLEFRSHDIAALASVNYTNNTFPGVFMEVQRFLTDNTSFELITPQLPIPTSLIYSALTQLLQRSKGDINEVLQKSAALLPVPFIPYVTNPEVAVLPQPPGGYSQFMSFCVCGAQIGQWTPCQDVPLCAGSAKNGHTQGRSMGYSTELSLKIDLFNDIPPVSSANTIPSPPTTSPHKPSIIRDVPQAADRNTSSPSFSHFSHGVTQVSVLVDAWVFTRDLGDNLACSLSNPGDRADTTLSASSTLSCVPYPNSNGTAYYVLILDPDSGHIRQGRFFCANSTCDPNSCEIHIPDNTPLEKCTVLYYNGANTTQNSSRIAPDSSVVFSLRASPICIPSGLVDGDETDAAMVTRTETSTSIINVGRSDCHADSWIVPKGNMTDVFINCGIPCIPSSCASNHSNVPFTPQGVEIRDGKSRVVGLAHIREICPPPSSHSKGLLMTVATASFAAVISTGVIYCCYRKYRTHKRRQKLDQPSIFHSISEVWWDLTEQISQFPIGLWAWCQRTLRFPTFTGLESEVQHDLWCMLGNVLAHVTLLVVWCEDDPFGMFSQESLDNVGFDPETFDTTNLHFLFSTFRDLMTRLLIVLCVWHTFFATLPLFLNQDHHRLSPSLSKIRQGSIALSLTVMFGCFLGFALAVDPFKVIQLRSSETNYIQRNENARSGVTQAVGYAVTSITLSYLSSFHLFLMHGVTLGLVMSTLVFLEGRSSLGYSPNRLISIITNSATLDWIFAVCAFVQCVVPCVIVYQIYALSPIWLYWWITMWVVGIVCLIRLQSRISDLSNRRSGHWTDRDRTTNSHLVAVLGLVYIPAMGNVMNILANRTGFSAAFLCTLFVCAALLSASAKWLALTSEFRDPPRASIASSTGSVVRDGWHSMPPLLKARIESAHAIHTPARPERPASYSWPTRAVFAVIRLVVCGLGLIPGTIAVCVLSVGVIVEFWRWRVVWQCLFRSQHESRIAKWRNIAATGLAGLLDLPIITLTLAFSCLSRKRGHLFEELGKLIRVWKPDTDNQLRIACSLGPHAALAMALLVSVLDVVVILGLPLSFVINTLQYGVVESANICTGLLLSPDYRDHVYLQIWKCLSEADEQANPNEHGLRMGGLVCFRRRPCMCLGTLLSAVVATDHWIVFINLPSASVRFTNMAKKTLHVDIVWPVGHKTLLDNSMEMYDLALWYALLFVSLSVSLFLLALIIDIKFPSRRGLAWSRLMVLLGVLMLLVAVLTPAIPNYSRSTDIAALCPYCAAEFHEKLMELLGDLIGMFSASILVHNSLVIVLTVSPTIARVVFLVLQTERTRQADERAILGSLRLILAGALCTIPLTTCELVIVLQQTAGDVTTLAVTAGIWAFSLIIAVVIFTNAQLPVFNPASPLHPSVALLYIGWMMCYCGWLCFLALYVTLKYDSFDLLDYLTDWSVWAEFAAEIALGNVVLGDALYTLMSPSLHTSLSAADGRNQTVPRSCGMGTPVEMERGEGSSEGSLKRSHMIKGAMSKPLLEGSSDTCHNTTVRSLDVMQGIHGSGVWGFRLLILAVVASHVVAMYIQGTLNF